MATYTISHSQVIARGSPGPGSKLLTYVYNLRAANGGSILVGDSVITSFISVPQWATRVTAVKQTDANNADVFVLVGAMSSSPPLIQLPYAQAPSANSGAWINTANACVAHTASVPIADTVQISWGVSTTVPNVALGMIVFHN